MNRKLSTIAAAAIAAAIILPAAGAAPALAAAGHKIAPGAHKHKTAVPNKLALRCKYKRLNLRFEISALHAAGYTRIKYQGVYVFRPRCAQFFKFSACKGGSRYNLRVRYIKGVNRFVIAQKVGICLVLIPNKKLKLKTR